MTNRKEGTALPPLPQAIGWLGLFGPEGDRQEVYTAAQMQDYARAALKGGEEKDVSSGSIGGDEPLNVQAFRGLLRHLAGKFDPPRLSVDDVMIAYEYTHGTRFVSTGGAASQMKDIPSGSGSIGGDEPVREPKTEIGRTLMAGRAAYIAGGGRLYTAEEISAELDGRFVSTGEPREPDKTTPKEGAQSSGTADLRCEYCAGHGEHWGADSCVITCGHCGGSGLAALSTASPQHAADDVVSSGSGVIGGDELPDVCDGKEQDAFEAWASGERFSMSQHPLHWLFLDPKTAAAREGWKAAIRYCRTRFASTGKTSGPNDPKSGSTASLSHDTPEAG